jgi:hypothetical protein
MEDARRESRRAEPPERRRDMAAEEVLPYCPFKKNEDAPILYWMAYRRGKQGGYAGTAVVATAFPVFTAPTEERLIELARELGYGLHREAVH